MPRTLWGGGGVLFTYKSTSLWRPPAPWPRGLQPQMGTLTHPCLSLTEGTQFSLWLRSHVYRPRRCRSGESSQGSVVLTDLCPLQLAQSKTLRATFFFFSFKCSLFQHCLQTSFGADLWEQREECGGRKELTPQPIADLPLEKPRPWILFMCVCVCCGE